jgi:FkbM family methyltransferase
MYFLYKSISDKEKIGFVRKNIQPGMTVLDIGANIGFYSILLSKLVGEKGHVIAFEPDALNFRHLLANTRKLANVTVHQAACGEKTEKLRLYLSDRFNVDHQTFDSGESRRYVEVQSVSIDDYLNNNEKVDFIKIDIQGYDFYAIGGSARIIKKASSLIILGELWPYGLNKAGVRPSEYINLLKHLSLSIQVPGVHRCENFDDLVHDRYFYTDFYACKESKRD